MPALDLDAIKARADAAAPYRRKPLGRLAHSAADVPVLIAEVERLRAGLDSRREEERARE